MNRIILHADMDAFFAAVEVLDDPSLAGLPLVVGGTGGRGVVSTASYEARKFKIGSALPMVTALRRCPHVVVRPPRFERYKEISQIVRGVFALFSDKIEPLSIDEAFLDMTGAETEFETPRALGEAVRRGIFEATGGLTASVGIANTKFLAKVASDFQKPDGLTVVAPDQAVAFLAPLPVKRLWGAGPKTVERLNALGYQTIADIGAADPAVLGATLGRQGLHFHRLANNQDTREVVTHREAKSVGCERTMAEDIVGAEAIRTRLASMAEEVARRLEKRGVRAHGIRVKLKTHEFQLLTRQSRMTAATADPQVIYRASTALLADFGSAIEGVPLRLVGVTGYELVGRGQPEQLWLTGLSIDAEPDQSL